MRSLCLLVMLVAMAVPFAQAADSQAKGTATANHCAIKGNINASGEHIYHMPGQAYYDRTEITPSKGERWFCSEAEARAAGWRRSKV